MEQINQSIKAKHIQSNLVVALLLSFSALSLAPLKTGSEFATFPTTDGVLTGRVGDLLDMDTKVGSENDLQDTEVGSENDALWAE